VSIHGLEITHDRVVRRKGSFRNALKFIRTLTENDIKVIVASVGMKSNYRELPRLAKFLVDHYKISAFRVLRLMPNVKSLIEEVIGPEECKWLIDKLHKLRDDTGLEVDIHVPPGCLHSFYYNPLFRPKLSHQFVSICTAGKASMAILSDGTVVPCVELKDLICGNILESEIEDIWNSD